ncbi:MAG: chromo domain-containing protein [Aeromonas sp.]
MLIFPQSLASLKSPLPQLDLEDETSYSVKDILDSRRRGGKLEYLVNWEGYRPEECSSSHHFPARPFQSCHTTGRARPA